MHGLPTASDLRISEYWILACGCTFDGLACPRRRSQCDALRAYRLHCVCERQSGGKRRTVQKGQWQGDLESVGEELGGETERTT
eukprot:4833782-Pleurochrysis_carterae.AAC.1